MGMNTSSLPGAGRLRNRLTTQIVLGIMLGFLAIGVIGALVLNTFSRQGLEFSQEELAGQLGESANVWFTAARDETLFLANNDVTRIYANALLDETYSAERRAEFLAALSEIFATSLQRANGTILAARFVTSNGFVMLEATQYEGESPLVLTQPRILTAMEQGLFEQGLNAQPGEVIVSPLLFRQRADRDQLFEPLTPYIRLVAPVTPSGDMMSLVGEIQIDVTPQAVFDSLLAADEDPGNFVALNRQLLLLDGENNLLLDSYVPEANLLRRLANGIGVPLASQLPEVTSLLNAGNAVSDSFPIGTRLYTLRPLSIGGTGDDSWRILVVDDLGASLTASVGFSIGILVLVAVLGGVVSYWVVRVLRNGLRPLEATVSAARQITTDGDAVATPLPNVETGVEEITQAFAHLRGQVESLNETIETRNQRYMRNMDIASRISLETARLDDVDTLLQRTINLICEEFNFYHAQIFVVDDVSEYAVLRFSYGEVGAALLAREHKLGVGSRSVVGQAIQQGQAIIINDTIIAGAIHRQNPLLPNTRAEIALPMRSEERVIGVLDIQSEQPNLFRAEEVQIFQLIADQLAVALQNARLSSEAQTRLRQVDDLNRLYIQQGWQDVLSSEEIQEAYRYNLMTVEPGAGRGDGYSVPIMVRGVTIGELTTNTAENLPLTEGDEAFMRAIADRVGLAIENARLVDEIQTSLTETFALYQLSRVLSEAQSLENVVAAIITTVMPDAEAGCIALFSDAKVANQTLKVSAVWHPTKDLPVVGAPLDSDENSFIRAISIEQITLVENVERDRRLDAPLRKLLHNDMGFGAVVIVPFSVRGVWSGVMILGYAQPRTFSEREGRLYSGLIDQAGVTIDNRVLLNENELALAQIERLYSGSRVVNMAQSSADVVRAAVATTDDLSMGFALALLEGDLDASGYPSQMRIVARSRGNDVTGADEVYPLVVTAESSLRQRQQVNISMDSREAGAGDFARFMRHSRYEFGLVFPLFSANQPFALFFVVSEDNKTLSSDDLEIYRALTGQMSTVLQNRRLLDQTAQALDETRRLYDASRAIAAAETADAIYSAAVQPLVAALPTTSRASIWLTSGDTSYDAPFVTNAYDWSRQTPTQTLAMRISADAVPFGRLFNAYHAALRYNRPKDELPPLGLNGLLSLLEKNGSGSVLIVPLQTRQKWLGVLMLESQDPDAFAAQIVPFAQAVADQLVLAIDSLNSFHEAQSQARRALALAEAGQVANRIGEDLGASLGEVFTRIADAASYRAWQLLLRDESSEWLEELVAHLPRAVVTRASRYEIRTAQHSIIDAYRSGEAVIVNDPHTYPAFANVPEDAHVELGKHLVVPIRSQQNETIGVLYFERSLMEENITERDEQLFGTLAAQIAVALENRRLLRSAEIERETLQGILNTLPVGVIVLDSRSLRPTSHNNEAELLLGREIDYEMMFTVETYNLYRTGTDSLYPVAEMPIYLALSSEEAAFADDVSIFHQNGRETDLLINAAPFKNASGDIEAIIVAFQNISTLRSLENTLQDNLRETIALYETTRALNEAVKIDDVLDLVVFQLSLQNSEEVYVLLQEEEGIRVARSLNTQTETLPIPSTLLDSHTPQFYANLTAIPNAIARQALKNTGAASIVILPLRSRARGKSVLGWVVLVFNTQQVFSLEREQSLTTLAESAAVTLDNRNLIISTENALAETASLYNATTAVSRAGSQYDLISALETAVLWLKPDCYALYLERDGSLQPTFNHSMDGAVLDFSAVAQVASLKTEPVLIADVNALPASDPFAAPLGALGVARALIAMPLKGQSLTGSLLIAYHTPQKYNDNVVRYLSALADSASVVADNVFLLDQIQTNLTETSMLYLASRDLNDAITEVDIVNVFTEHLLDSSISRVMVLTLNGRNWGDDGASVTVTATWQPSDSPMPDLVGTILEKANFAAWSLFDTLEVFTSDDVMNDVRLTAEQRDNLLQLGIASFSLLPLRSAQQVIGVMLLSSDIPNATSETNLRVYRSFARQASLRLEASRLLEQTQRRERQLVTSARVSQLASSLEELPRLLPTIVEMIKDAFAYDHAQIFLMDEENRFAVLRASTGEAGEKLLARNHKLEKGSQSVIGRVTATGEPVIALDTASSRVPHKPNPLLPKTRSEMAVPLILKGEVVGALDVQSNMANFFNDDDVTVLTTLAAQISVAIDNAQLYDQTRARAKDMYFLFTVASAASGAETLQDASTNIVGSLQELLNSASVSLYLPITLSDGENEITELRPMAVAGTTMPLSEISQVRMDDPGSLLAEAAASRRPILIDNVSSEPRYLSIIPDAQSAMLVPLTFGADLVALIVVEDEKLNAFNDDSLTLLLTLSGSLAATVQNQQLLEDLQRSNEQLVELDRLKSDFLANMSHELRTPLNSIIGFSRVILKGIDGPLTEMQEQDLTTIYNSGQHLLNLINDILDQAKIAAGKMDMQTEYFEIKPVIDGVRSIGIGLVKDKPIEISVHLEPSLPKAYGDEFRIRQVLLNLVSNAAKFTDQGSITIHAYTLMDAEFDVPMMAIDVTDTGMGIAHKDLPLLFEAFRQVDSSLTKTHGGTGLGLPIAKNLMEMMGGTILVESTVNVGSTFSIRVPTAPLPEKPGTGELIPPPEMPTPSTGATGSLDPSKLPPHVLAAMGDGDAVVPEPSAAPAAKPTSQDTEKQFIPVRKRMPVHVKRQILLVEDNLDMVDQLRRTLQREGFEVFTVSTAMEAEAMASGLRPTLIVIDADFANASGWALLERFRQRDDTLDTPIIVLSLGDHVTQAEAGGAFRFIRKPFMPETLADAARAAEAAARIDRILIIDDDNHAARLLQDILGEGGSYRVYHATNGIDGVSMVARRRPDLVICDLRMPDMDGFKVIQELRSNPETADIPIMVVTGDTLNQHEIMQLSQMRVIYKPDIDMEGRRVFLDNVKDQLSRTNGNN
jgi:GAF domain-containing protein/DNA-binding response OmpR family regulator